MSVALTTTYEKHSLRAAARSIFFDRQKPFFPWRLAWLTGLLLVSGIVAYALEGLGTIAIVLLLLFLADVCLRAIAYIWHYKQLMKLCGATARFEFDDSHFRQTLLEESNDIPWGDIRRISINEWGTVLYLDAGVAAIIPTSSIPEDGMALIKQKQALIGPMQGRANGG